MPGVARDNTKSTNTSKNVDSFDKRHSRRKRGPYDRISLEKRKEMIDLVIQCGLSVGKAATRYRVPRSTVNSMLDTYLKGGRYEVKKMGGLNQKVKITNEVSDFLRVCMDENNDITIKE